MADEPKADAGATPPVDPKPADASATPPVEKPLLAQDAEPKPGEKKDEPTDPKPELKPKLDADGKPVLDKDGKPVMEEAKKDGEKPPQGAPEKYADFKVPEGVTLDPKDAEEFSALAKESNLTQEQAQKFIDKATAHAQSLVEKATAAQDQEWATARKGWTEAIKADPEIGGAKFAESRELAIRAVKTHGTSELVKQVFESGWGDHPELFKFCVRVGKAMSEDQSLGGRPPMGEDKSAAQVMFPSQAK